MTTPKAVTGAGTEGTSNSLYFLGLLLQLSTNQTQPEARGHESQYIQISVPGQPGGQRREAIDVNEALERCSVIPQLVMLDISMAGIHSACV